MTTLRTILSTILAVAIYIFTPMSMASQPLTIVTNLPVGSNPDVIIRKYAEVLSKRLNRAVLVNNRPGASGAVALDYYVNNVTDSQTIYIGDVVNFAAMPVLYNREHLLTAIKPVMLLYRSPWVIAASSKFQSTEEALEQFKKTPVFGSWAVGSPAQICGHELSSKLTGAPGTHIAYKEYSQWYIDLTNKNLTISCTTFGSSFSFYQDNKIQYIAVTGKERHPRFPKIPTLNELLSTDFVSPDGWVGVFVKNSADPKFIETLEKEFLEISKSKEIKDLLDSSMIVNTSTMGTNEFTKFLPNSINQYKYLIKKFGITAN